MKRKEKKEIRRLFNEAVFERDGHKCVFCDETEDLDAHHITDRHLLPNGGYVIENGITLCKKHHRDAEKFHETEGKKFVEGFRPEDLYKAISSSWRDAMRVCKADWVGSTAGQNYDEYAEM